MQEEVLPFFESPMQILFYDPHKPESNPYSFGIAVADQVICGCCGNVIAIVDIRQVALADNFTEPFLIIFTCGWMPMTEEEFFNEDLY